VESSKEIEKTSGSSTSDDIVHHQQKLNKGQNIKSHFWIFQKGQEMIPCLAIFGCELTITRRQFGVRLNKVRNVE
jgi:hypothetical protein